MYNLSFLIEECMCLGLSDYIYTYIVIKFINALKMVRDMHDME